jgi:dTDP-4-amino-4,6-dideoxygalactose transaminase
MAGGLVPRTRPNLDWRDLLRAGRVSEAGTSRRATVVERLGSYTEHEHVALTASGRGALLALLATAGRPRAVIPGYTCKAVVEAAEIAGVKVDLIDVSGGYNWGPGDIDRIVGPDAVVVLTHQYGIPCAVEEIAAAARNAGSAVIEDCAGGLAGRRNGRRLGSFGDAAFYSFDMSKLVHVPPKGGALTLADRDWADRAKQWLDRETHVFRRPRKISSLAQAAVLSAIGPRAYRLLHTVTLSARNRATTETPDLRVERDPFYDSAFAEWQAEIALPQLDALDQLAADVRRLYARYRDGLAGCGGIELPPPDEEGEWAPIRFPVLVRGDKFGFYEQLLSRGVDSAFSFTYIARPREVPRASEIASRVLCLPFYPRLPEADADRVIRAVRDVTSKWTG